MTEFFRKISRADHYGFLSEAELRFFAKILYKKIYMIMNPWFEPMSPKGRHFDFGGRRGLRLVVTEIGKEDD